MPTLTGTPRRIIVLAMFAAAMTLVGLRLADLANGELGVTTSTLAETTTLHHTQIIHKTQLVMVKVKGRVIRRFDHVIVVQVPKTVFHTRTHPSRRIVVPRHIVRIFRRPKTPTSPVQSLIQGVAPPPTTVVVTQEIPVPGPTVTETVTDVQTVTETQLVPTTVTVTVSLPVDTTG